MVTFPLHKRPPTPPWPWVNGTFLADLQYSGAVAGDSGSRMQLPAVASSGYRMAVNLARPIDNLVIASAAITGTLSNSAQISTSSLRVNANNPDRMRSSPIPAKIGIVPANRATTRRHKLRTVPLDHRRPRRNECRHAQPAGIFTLRSWWPLASVSALPAYVLVRSPPSCAGASQRLPGRMPIWQNFNGVAFRRIVIEGGISATLTHNTFANRVR